MATKKQKPVLASVKLQRMIDLKEPEKEYFRPVLNFGRKKSDQFGFPIIFTDKQLKRAEKCLAELMALKGQTVAEVKISAVLIFQKYKYKKP